MANKNLNWHCINQCGACCRLDPMERIDSLELLSEDQLDKYMSMVGADGWCIHYDKSSKRCNIYSNRPSFCKVANLDKTFKIKQNDLNDFAISCCKQQIRFVYGGRSIVMKKYSKKIRTDINRYP